MIIFFIEKHIRKAKVGHQLNSTFDLFKVFDNTDQHVESINNIVDKFLSQKHKQLSFNIATQTVKIKCIFFVIILLEKMADILIVMHYG